MKVSCQKENNGKEFKKGRWMNGGKEEKETTREIQEKKM
jgi:hypothetical protein